MDINIESVEKAFGTQKVLDGVSLHIPHGKLTTLLGPSGCGKTTLLRIISGLEKPDAGRLVCDGTTMFSAGEGINIPPEKRSLGFVFQDFSLWPHLSVFENVAFGLRARGIKNQVRERTLEALASVRLESHAEKMPHQLSGGQQQRVSIARAIVTQPACILFDEPLSALDAVLRSAMRDEIRDMIVSRGLTGVFVTHDQEEAMGISDIIVLMEGGHIIQTGSPQELYSRPAHPFAARFIGQTNWLDSHSFIRPEDISTQHGEERDAVAMNVVSQRFCGDGYMVTVQDEKRTWSVKTAHNYKIGESIALYYKKEAVITYEGDKLS